MADDRLVWKFNCPQQVASIKSHRDGAGRDEVSSRNAQVVLRISLTEGLVVTMLEGKTVMVKGKENRVGGSPETAGGSHGHL